MFCNHSLYFHTFSTFSTFLRNTLLIFKRILVSGFWDFSVSSGNQSRGICPYLKRSCQDLSFSFIFTYSMERQRKESSEQDKYENSVPERNSCITGSQVPENVYNSCSICHRIFRTYRGLIQHRNACKRKQSKPSNEETITTTIESSTEETTTTLTQNFKWNNVDGNLFTNELNHVYDTIVYWRKNLFMLPTGSAGKKYICEITRLINAWVNDTPMKNISLKAVHVMPALLLQKPEKKSKMKDHIKALERRLKLWDEGNLLELLFEGSSIQERLKSTNMRADIAQISKKFGILMGKGEVNAALKLLTNNMNNGILPLNDETLLLLEQKHPIANESCEDVILNGHMKRIHPIVYDVINEDMIMQAASNTKGGSGPSGMDADGWRRILCSSVYGTCNSDLRKTIADMIKKLCSDIITVENGCSSLEAFVACRMIPLNKNPGLRPIGVGEVLRRIAGKVVMKISKSDVIESVGSLQVCAGQEAGIEAAVHAMHDIYDLEETEAVLLIDAENAFNSINRKAMINNICILCPIIGTYVKNCYTVPARLFILGGKEILSKEGTTQGDPTAMASYAIGLTPLLKFLFDLIKEQHHNTKEVAYADDFTVAGKIKEIKEYWAVLTYIGPKYGYFPKAEKSFLIVKNQHVNLANEVFQHSNVKITTNGERHLGAVIGSNEYRKDYVDNKINSLVEQLKLLSKIAETEPQAAYSAFAAGFKHKLTYILRTIPNISERIRPLEDTLRNTFIPAITGGYACNDNERILLSLPTRYGGLGLNLFEADSDIEYHNSRLVTESLTTSIINQEFHPAENQQTMKQAKNIIRVSREERYKEVLLKVRNNMNARELKLNDNSQEKGTSNWLTVIPLSDQGFSLNKQQFWDAIRLRYGWFIANLPTNCVCGASFDTQHCMNCKKGGFVTMRHNELRDLTANMLTEVCKDVAIEPFIVRNQW